jgi:hypothetical protein
MGSAADALTDLTGVKPNAPAANPLKFTVTPEDAGPAASALRSLMGIEQPSSFAERFAPAEEQPLERVTRREPPPKPDNFGKIGIDFENQQLAASQRTAPNPADYKKLVSSDVYQNDAGQLLYPDPNTGELAQTDRNKHIVLRDPEDGKLKIYARSGDTDEGMLSAAGRMLGTGLASGAPVSRAYQAASVARPAEEVIAASGRLSKTGGEVTVPRVISTDSVPVQEIGSVAANIPLAGTPLVKASSNTIRQLGEKAGEVAGEVGSKASVAQSGDVARQSITNWITKKSPDTADKLYGKVDALIDPDAKGALTNTMAAIDKIEAERKAAGLGPSKAAAQVMEAATRPEGVTYGGIKTLRTTIGEQTKSGILPEGVSAGELNRVYGALTKDMGGIVDVAGSQPAKDAFERANTYYRLASDRRESLAKIVGADGNASAESVFDRLKAMAGSTSRADISKLAQARKVMGSDDWNEVASTVISRLGRDTDGNFSPRRFLTDYNKMSPAGKNLLFKSGGKGEIGGYLDDIATISSRFKELEKFSNPSGTSRSVVGAVIGSGLWNEPLSTLSSVLGGRLVASYLAMPAGASSIAKWSRANLLLAQAPTPARLSAFTTATKNLIATTGAKNVSVSDFLKALQSPSVSHAEDNKQ